MFLGYDDFSVDGNHPEIVEYQCEGYFCCKDLLDEGNNDEVRMFLQGWIVNIKWMKRVIEWKEYYGWPSTYKDLAQLDDQYPWIERMKLKEEP